MSVSDADAAVLRLYYGALLRGSMSVSDADAAVLRLYYGALLRLH